MGNKRARPAAAAAPKAAKAVALEELDADAFMRGDFLDEQTAESSGDDSAADGADEGDDSSASDGDDDDDDEDAPGALGADSDSDSDNEDDAPSHAAQLRALSEKDPEFFQYLQGEEPDLLAFDPAELEVRCCATLALKHAHQ
jgi:nucleolar complex protein 2